MRQPVLILGAALVTGVFVSSAGAGVIGGFDPTLTVDAGDSHWDSALIGGPNKDGTWNYGGSHTEATSGGSWTVDYNIDATRDEAPTVRGAQTTFLFNNLVLTNNTGMTQTVTITTMIPVFPAILPSSVMGGSASGTLTTNGDGGTMSNVNGADPMYRALIDGVAVGGIADLLNFDSSVSVAGFGSGSTGFEDFGTPIPSAPGPAVLNSIGITLQFDLTDGDAVSWTSVFVVNVVPTPGAGALFGLAGFAAIRRRR